MRLAGGLLAMALLAGAPLPEIPPAAEQQEIIAQARERALQYVAALPNFTCTESIQRSERIGVRNVSADRLTVQVSFAGRQEQYKLTAINGNRTDRPLNSIDGLISGGEFGTFLLRLFDPSTAADFEWKEWSSAGKRRAAVFRYRVARVRSHYVVGYRTADGKMSSVTAGYRGEVVLDRETEPGRVLRLTAEADDIPKESGILGAHMSVDYDFVEVAGRAYALPVRSESALERPHREIRSLAKFTGYRKFDVESTLTFGGGGTSATPPPATAPPVEEPEPTRPVEHEIPMALPPPPPRTEPVATPKAPPTPPPAPEVTFHSTSQLALIGFQVVSNKGQLIRDLRPEEIEVREDGVPQKIAVFEGSAGRSRTVPIEVALLFDCSYSVEVAGALNPQVFRDNLLDEFENVTVAVYGFSDYLVRATRPTRDPAVLKKAADSVRTVTPRDTPLFGAIAEAAQDFGSTPSPVVRMMAILSDGESFWPGDLARREEAIRAARQGGISLYPVLLAKSGVTETKVGSTAPVTVRPEVIESVSQFTELGAATGGRGLSGLMNTDVLPAVLKSIATQIRGSYVVGFYPAVSSTAKPHRVEVVLLGKGRGSIHGGVRTVVH